MFAADKLVFVNKQVVVKPPLLFVLEEKDY
jgi:hypothetical protein